VPGAEALYVEIDVAGFDRSNGRRPKVRAATRLGLREARPKTTRLQTARVQSAEPERCVHDRGALRDRLEVGSSLFFWEPKMGCGLLANSTCTPVEVFELVQVGVLGAGDHAGACHPRRSRHGVGQRTGHPVGAEVSICFHPGLALSNAPAGYKVWLASLSERLI
jgi:hypothetical protein